MLFSWHLPDPVRSRLWLRYGQTWYSGSPSGTENGYSWLFEPLDLEASLRTNAVEIQRLMCFNQFGGGTQYWRCVAREMLSAYKARRQKLHNQGQEHGVRTPCGLYSPESTHTAHYSSNFFSHTAENWLADNESPRRTYAGPHGWEYPASRNPQMMAFVDLLGVVRGGIGL